MALDLNSLATKSATISVVYMGQTAQITYKPSLLTQGNITKARETDQRFTEFFCSLVKDWDVKKAQRKVPITTKGLMDVPYPFLRSVFQHILYETGNEGQVEEEGKPSSAG